MSAEPAHNLTTASFPSGEHRGATQPPVPSFVALADVAQAFAASNSQARRKAALRWAQSLGTRGRAKKINGRWYVCKDARLPDNLTVESHLLVGRREQLAGYALPAGHEQWSNKDRQRFLNSHELLKLYDVCRRDHCSASDQAVFDAFFAIHRQRIHELGFKNCSIRTLRRMRDRLGLGPRLKASPNFDGNVDGRGRSKADVDGGGGEAGEGGKIPTPANCTADAWELFLSIYLAKQTGRNQLNLKQCWRFVEGEARENDWQWPSYSAVRTWANRKIPAGVFALARGGPKHFEAHYVPKIAREYTDIEAGAWWCLDGRTLDIMCRVPDDRKNWRRARLVVTGINDMRSRVIVGWDIRATENSDGIIAGIRQAMQQWGAPTDAIVDNGKAYKAATGTPRGTSKQREYFDDPRIGSVFAQTGVQVHNSIPFHSWAKQIESLWTKVKDGFDRWFWCFWGGSPDERPEGMDKWTKQRIDDLPTVDEIRDAFQIFMDEYHATEQTGTGTNGLSPNLVMEQYRGPIRRVDAALLDLLCCRTVGPVKVTRDGIRHNHVLYGQKDEAVWKLQGREVYLRIHPERADLVTVCEEDGTPICHATNRRLSGATQDDIRESQKAKARYRRAVKEYLPARDFLRETPTTQILKSKRKHAQAREAAARADLPEPQQPPVTLVRPDLTDAARKLQNQRTVKPAPRRPIEQSSKPDRDGFDRLADHGDGAAPISSRDRFVDLDYEDEFDVAEPGSCSAWDRLSEAAG